MKKFLACALLLIVIAALAGCFVIPIPAKTETPSAAILAQTPRPSASAVPAPSDPLASPSTPPSAPVPPPSGYSFADAKEVFANPDAYKEMEYASPFLLASEPQAISDSITVYYAEGYCNGSKSPCYTVLEFSSTSAPDLKAGSSVYIRGIIQGKGTLYDDTGNSVDMLWLSVTEYETDASAAALPASQQEFRFDDGKYRAVQDTLSIEIIGLTFNDDGLMLSTKTIDTSAQGFTTYYFDIIIHQDGLFAWYPGCNFWIDVGVTGYDNILFPPLDDKKDMTIEFVPFSENGELLYRPLVIDIPLSQLS